MPEVLSTAAEGRPRPVNNVFIFCFVLFCFSVEYWFAGNFCAKFSVKLLRTLKRKLSLTIKLKSSNIKYCKKSTNNQK